MTTDRRSPRRSAAVSRRVALGALAATGVGYTLFGPRGRRRAWDDRVVLDYWEKWTGHEGRAMLEIVERFNRSQDRIAVRYFATSNIDQKAMVAIAGGNPPDVLGLWSYSLPAYVQAGAVQRLDELEATHGLGPGHYADAIWPLMRCRGHRYAAVNTCGTVALYYNRRLFRDAGLDPNRPPRTIGELDEAAAALTVIGPGDRVETAGFLPVEPGWWSWAWGYFFGGRLYDPATAQVTADSPENVRAYRWVQEFASRFGVEALNRLRSTFGNYASMQQSFLAGKVAMQLQGPWLANVIDAFAPELDYAAAPFPVDETRLDPARPSGIVESDLLVVPRGARHRAEALAFIAFTQRQDNVEWLSHQHAKGSPLRRTSAEFIARHPNRALAVHQAILESPRVFAAPQMRTWPQYRDEINAGFDRIWSLQADPGDVLRAIDHRAQGQVDLAALRQRQRRRVGSS